MSLINRAFWAQQRVLVTGCSGFKGSWLCLWLSQLGAEVHGIGLAPASPGNLFELAQVARDINYQQLDIRDIKALSAAVGSMQPTVILHLAAQALVPTGIEQPLLTFSSNVMGSVNLLEACRQSDSVKAIVMVTSDKCYQPQTPARSFVEADPLGGLDPYSASKACTELVSQAFAHSYPDQLAPLARARAGNVIGGGDWAERRLVTDLVAALNQRQPLQLRCPEAVRPWQWVMEPLAGYLQLAQALVQRGQAYAGGWNFAPTTEKPWSVLAMAKALAGHWPQPLDLQVQQREWPETEYLALNSDLARKRLNWRSRLSTDECVSWTAAWYRQFELGQSARQLTLAQIADYQQRLDDVETNMPVYRAQQVDDV